MKKTIALSRRLGRWMKNQSIQRRIIFAFVVIAGGMLCLNLSLLAQTQSFSAQYHAVTARVAEANHLVPLAYTEIGTAAYYITTGRETPTTSALPRLLQETRESLNALERRTKSEQSCQHLRVAGRVLNTLDRYAAQLMQEVQHEAPLARRNATLDQIRSVSELLYDTIGSYIYSELDYFEGLDGAIQHRVSRLIIVNFSGLAVLMAVLLVLLYTISTSITRPIDLLIQNTKKLAAGDFDAHVTDGARNEITALNRSFNDMVEKLQALMDTVRSNAREREQLELRLLQEQINPHFLYNTLEMIIWMAESGDQKQVIQIVQSLSRFFRTVLSGGRDIVTVREELTCIESYLFIQRVRYGDIMDYAIDAEEDALGLNLQKLSLQPLVENALYHGLKVKRGGGTIRLTVRREADALVLCVEDDGCGMTQAQLYALQQGIVQPDGNGTHSFGLSNLQKRVQLYCGKAYGLTLASQLGVGTTATLRVSVSETPPAAESATSENSCTQS